MGGQYQVQRIIEKRQRGRTQEYKVKWKGYPMSECTWQPQANLSSCRQILQEFKRSTRKDIKQPTRPMAIKTNKPRQPEKPKMKRKPAQDEDQYDFDQYREPQDSADAQASSSHALKRPPPATAIPKPKKMTKNMKTPTYNAQKAVETQAQDQEEQQQDENNEPLLIKKSTLEVLAMFHNGKKAFCYKVRDLKNNKQSIINKNQLINTDSLALINFYESKIKFSSMK